MNKEHRQHKFKSISVLLSFVIFIYILFILSINTLDGINSITEETQSNDKAKLSKYSSKNRSKMITEKTLQTERLIFLFTNKIRMEHNLKTFKLNSKLSDIARSHSLDMVKRNYFSHTNPEGKSPTDRARDKGFIVRKFLNDKSYIDTISENIAKMPTGLVLYRGYVEDTPEDVAKAILKSWMIRPGHRTNILMYFSTEIGIGVAYDGKYYIATQNFY